MPEEIKERVPVWLYPSTLKKVDDLLQMDNDRSRSEFIEKAIHFYAGFLGTKDATAYLSDTLLQSFKGVVKSSEGILRGLIYGLSVEAGLVARIVGEYESLTPEQVAQKREGVIKDLQKTKGGILHLHDEAERAQQDRLYGRE